MDEVRAGLREAAEDNFCIALRIRPLVMVVVHLALRDADPDRHLGADLRPHSLEGFEDQSHAVLRGAAPRIRSVVGVVGQKLVEKISIGAVDLDCIKSGNRDCAPGRLSKAVDGVGDLCLRNRDRQSVGALTMVERHLFALGLDWRRPHSGVAKAIALAECSGVQHLCNGERTVRLDAADDWLPGIGLRFVSHAGLMEVALRECLIGVDAFGDDCPEATSRETLVVAGHRLGRPAILGRRDARHRRDREAVLYGMTVYNDRREKRASINIHRPGL